LQQFTDLNVFFKMFSSVPALLILVPIWLAILDGGEGERERNTYYQRNGYASEEVE
jgi:hypothetical protein